MPRSNTGHLPRYVADNSVTVTIWGRSLRHLRLPTAGIAKAVPLEYTSEFWRILHQDQGTVMVSDKTLKEVCINGANGTVS